MPGKTFKTAVVIIPPEEIWPPIQSIRERYDRHFRRWMPHITLIYPFRPVEEFKTLLPSLAGICAVFPPFRIELGTFHRFQHAASRSTLWLEPRPGDLLIDLQAKLQQVVPDCNEGNRFPGGFTPHLSVGQSGSKKAADKRILELQKIWRPIAFQVDQITLIWRKGPPEDRFQVGETIPLGQSKG